jgi:hypothetical protein
MLNAMYLPPEGPGNIWMCLQVLVKLTAVSRKFVCGFQTDLHFADIDCLPKALLALQLGTTCRLTDLMRLLVYI